MMVTTHFKKILKALRLGLILLALGIQLIASPLKADNYFPEKLPRIIFVPGILGSSIAICRSNDRSLCSRCSSEPQSNLCETIWGPKDTWLDTFTNIATANLELNPDLIYITTPIDEMAWNKVYFGIITSLKNISPDANLYNPFGYDWRRSLKYNADLLRDYVCEIQSKYPDAPIYIVSHSMGGLIVRYWLDFSPQRVCPNGILVNIGGVLYVATPHRDSVKAILSLLSGFKYYLDDSWYAPLNKLFLPLNKAGPTFESLYELFPVQASNECQSQITKLREIAYEGVIQLRDSTENVDIFNPNILDQFALYKAVGSVSGRNDLKNIIPYWLTRSAHEVCELEKRNQEIRLASKENNKFKKFYFYGLLPDASTLKSLVITRTPKDDIVVTNGALDRGDGTVLTQSAKNVPLIPSEQRFDNRKPIGKDHIAIINDGIIIERVREYVDSYKTKLLEENYIETARLSGEKSPSEKKKSRSSTKCGPTSSARRPFRKKRHMFRLTFSLPLKHLTRAEKL